MHDEPRRTRRDPAREPASRATGCVALAVAVARDLVRLVVPVACAGCGLADVPWCDACAAHLHGPPVRRDHGAGRLDLLEGRTLLPVLAPAAFAGPVRHAVTAWKDGGRADLDRPFAAALRRTGRHLGGAADRGGSDPSVPSASRPSGRRAPASQAGARRVAGAVLVVAVPSSAAARRRRGRAPVDVLAGAVAAGLRDVGVEARRAAPLVRAAGPDLAGLGARARGAALVGRVRVRRARAVRGREVVLVDDVLTTGATLAECHAALVAAGARVRAACTLAATPSPDDPAAARVPRTAVAHVRSGARSG